jgi:hypothetical protein
MIPVDFDVVRVDQALRLVRALGAHRYIAGRLHLVHALCIASIGDDAGGTLADARAWAVATTDHRPPGLEVASRDERLWRACSEPEIAAVLDAYWTPGARSRSTREALRERLERHGLVPPDGAAPFDEALEDQIHPMMLDAGWQLLDLGELDPERHRGAIAAFGDDLAFESAVFEEETAIPPPVHLCELPAIGAVELLRGADDTGKLAEPWVVWVEGDEIYLDYVLRGVRRAAKLGDAS